MFCPNCGFEYQDDVKECPDCGEQLVESLPESSEEEAAMYEDWVELARLTSLQSAEMLLEDLRDKDIPAVLRSGTGYFGMTGQFGPSSFRPVGGAFTLLVPEEFVPDADQEGQAILGNEWEKGKLVDISDYDNDDEEEEEEE
jgi:predicted  nucleic acid-binding Zn-ribbon protein